MPADTPLPPASAASAELIVAGVRKYVQDNGGLMEARTRRHMRQMLTDAIAAALQSRDQAARESCAAIVDAECARILSKQHGDISDPVNINLRMIAVVLPEIAAAIRAPAGDGR